MEPIKFVDCQHPILHARCRLLAKAEIQDPSMQQLFDGMFTFARGEQTDLQRHVLVGLAAPQIGKDIRVILVDIKADGRGGVSELCLYINPEILELSQEAEEWYEGCFSTGDVKGDRQASASSENQSVGSRRARNLRDTFRIRSSYFSA